MKREQTVQVDQAGRIVLPKPMRDRFRLRRGDKLTIEVKGDAIELKPSQSAGQLKSVNGVLVYAGAEPLESGEDYVAQSREERTQELINRFGHGQ